MNVIGTIVQKTIMRSMGYIVINKQIGLFLKLYRKNERLREVSLKSSGNEFRTDGIA